MKLHIHNANQSTRAIDLSMKASGYSNSKTVKLTGEGFLVYLSLLPSGEWYASIDYHGHLPSQEQIGLVIAQILALRLVDNRTWGIARRSPFCAQVGTVKMLQEAEQMA